MISILFILAIWHSRIAVNPGKATEKKVFPPLILHSSAATENEC